MNKIICFLNNKKYIIEKDNDCYKYNDKIFSVVDTDLFISNLIKMCCGIERRKPKSKINNKIEIYYSDKTITLTGIDIRVIKYINSFLK